MSALRPSDQRIREYVESVKRIEQLEEEVKGEILEYLIYNQYNAEVCTLRGLERHFGIPYTRLRRLMADLTAEGVVAEGSIGNAKPYRVLDLSLVFSKGYIKRPMSRSLEGKGSGSSEASGEDLPSFVKMYGIQNVCLPWSFAIHGEVKGEELFRSMPRGFLIPPAYELFMDICSQEESNGYDPEAEEQLLKQVEGKWPKEELAHRKQLLQERKERMSPEKKEMLDRLRKWGIVRLMGGGAPFWYTPLMRTNMIRPPLSLAEERLVGECMRHSGLPKDAFTPLRHFPATNPREVYFRDVMFELDVPTEAPSKEELLAALRKVVEKQLRYLLLIMAPMIESVEKNGVQATLASWNSMYEEYQHRIVKDVKGPLIGNMETEKYTPWHILFEAVCLANASYLTMVLGGDPELAEKGREISFALARAVEGEQDIGGSGKKG